jgi:peptidoglycan/LPS O-acetylase OafA/YrhL
MAVERGPEASVPYDEDTSAMRITPGLYRLFLATVVVLHHSTPLRLGGWAVGLFFVLSGYWIAEMWDRKYGSLDWPYPEFVVSRWWRLAPVLFGVTALAAVTLGRGAWGSDGQVLHHWTWWVAQPAIAGSASFGRLLPPAWSLDVEMQFYLVAPLLIIVVTRLSATLTVVAIAVGVLWCGYLTAIGRADESPRLDVWAGVFLIGVAASVHRWRWPRPIVLASVLLTLIAFAAVAVLPVTRPWILLRGATGHRLTGPLAATLAVGTLLLAVPFTLATTAVPSGRVDRFLGDLSYPLYLFHWIPRQWFYAHLGPNPRPASALALLAVNLIMAAAGAIVLLLVVDRPAQRLRARWVGRHAATRQAAAAINSPEPPAAFAGTV